MSIAMQRRAGMDQPAPEARLTPAFRAVRAATLRLAAPLSPEDAMLQSMPEASPTKWQLAHTTWFLEQFVLAAEPGYRMFDERLRHCLNSYYQSLGSSHPRPQRGLLSRPSLDEVRAYRDEIDTRVEQRLARGVMDARQLELLELCLHHEQQHQELILTDIKHAFALNPLLPAYRSDCRRRPAVPSELRWLPGTSGTVEIGADAWPGAPTFAYDNESPRHTEWLAPHALASRPVSNAEYAHFIRDGGYRDPRLWLSAGWDWLAAQGIDRPLYWDEALECAFTLSGQQPIEAAAPVVHLAFYEADAFARWAGARLPTEAEWEHAAARVPIRGNFVESDALHPQGGEASVDHQPAQLFGDVWEWTASAYRPYPGFRELPGSLGEYNGKFMSGQYVLRGGSCASPQSHLRASYRNFFGPGDRWQFTGLRLARDA